MLAILHVELDRPRQELRLFIKLRWLNLMIAGISLGIVALVLIHAIADR